MKLDPKQPLKLLKQLIQFWKIENIGDWRTLKPYFKKELGIISFLSYGALIFKRI